MGSIFTEDSPNIRELKDKYGFVEIYTIPREKLLPAAREIYDTMAARLGYAPEIFVDHLHRMQGRSYRQPPATPLSLADGKRGLLISEMQHRWDGAFVRDHYLNDDAYFKTLPPSPDTRVQQAYRALVKQANIDPVPLLLLGEEGEAHVSTSGRKYVTLPNGLTFDEAVGTIAHELSHILHDCTPESYAQRHNEQAHSTMVESRADRFAAELGKNRELAKVLIKFYADVKYDARKKGLTVEQYEAINDPNLTHPRFMDRIREITNYEPLERSRAVEASPPKTPAVPHMNTLKPEGPAR